MIRLCKPEIDFDEVAAPIKEVLTNGQLTQGKYLEKFEVSIADYINVKHAISTTSATTALHLSLVLMGVQPGDEVLISDFTFPATGNVVCQIGAIPILVDCKKDSFEMCYMDLKRKITEKTKVILVVDPFGQPVDFEAVKEIARENKLYILEDAACALGAQRNGTFCGTWADLGVFSFHPRKLITTGEGGMITTNNDELAGKGRILLSHGSVNGSYSRSFIDNGFNYRLGEISAILGLEQMTKLNKILNNRRELAKVYLELLKDVEYLKVPLSSKVDECTFQSFVVLLDASINRNKVIDEMRNKKIEVTIGTYAMHSEPAFSRFGYKSNDLVNSYFAFNQSLTLPLYIGLTPKDLNCIVESLKESVLNARMQT